MDLKRNSPRHLYCVGADARRSISRRSGNRNSAAFGIAILPTPTKRRRGERGTAALEFAFAFALFWIPLFLGMVVIGFNLIRAVQVTQVCRDAGHMYAYGIDFSQSAYQNLLVNLAIGLNMTTTGGNGVVILSSVTYIDSAACTAGGYQADTTHCPNLNTIVFTRRIVIGNSTLHSSNLGSPNSAELDSSGNVSVSGYLTDTANQVSNFSSIIPLTAGQFAFVSEMFVNSPDTSWWTAVSTPHISARSIF